MNVWLHSFLTSALDGGDLVASRPGRFTPGTHWTWGWVGSIVGLDSVARTDIPALPRIEPWSSSLWPSRTGRASLYSYLV